MQLQVDQEVTHTPVDFLEYIKETRSITIQPDRHGLTIKFEGEERKYLYVELKDEVFFVRKVDPANQHFAVDSLVDTY